MKKLIVLTLALLLALTLVACGGKEDSITDDPVIDLGTAALTFSDEAGNVYTYEYLTSTTITIVAFDGISDEPSAVSVPGTHGEYTVAAIGAEAFHADSSIASLTLPEGITTIGEYAFADCEALIEVKLPKSLTTLEKGAFYGCDHLSSLDLSATAVTAIGDYAFANSPVLAEIKWSAGLTSIGTQAFSNCAALTAIDLPEGVASLGTQAFYGCDAVTKINLPASLTEIGNYALDSAVRAMEAAGGTATAPEGSAAAAYLAGINR